MAKRNGKTCVLFRSVPEGTHYREGAYSWVTTATAEQYIAEGYGVEYDPKAGQVVELEPPTMDNTKKEIEQYLDAKGIEYSEYLTKAELLELINGEG